MYHDTETAKKKDIARFLRVIRQGNPVGTIVLVWDNARAHLSKLVRRTAHRLDIILVFLPPYSPDLNPIAFIWKSIKKERSSRIYMTKEEVRDAVEEMFYRFASSLSFAGSWIEKFFTPTISS